MATTKEGKKKSLQAFEKQKKIYELRKKIKQQEGRLMPNFMIKQTRRTEK